MPRRWLTTLGLLLLLTSSAQVGYSSPAAAMAKVQAEACCAHACEHARALADSARCCQVLEAESAPALSAAVPAFEPPATAVLALEVIAPGALGSAPGALSRSRSRVGRASPIFILTRSLLL